MEAYVISLNNPSEKLDYLKKNGIDPILVKGVNGKKISKDEIYNRVSLFYYYFGPLSAIGCALSHFLVWKMFLETDREYAIIFEDDVILENDFVEKTTLSLKNVPEDYDILYLGCFGCTNKPNLFSILTTPILNKGKKINDYISIPEVAYATHSYIVSRKGAEKLLKLLDGKLYNHIDICLQELASKKKINVYVTTPRLAYQTSTDTTSSENLATKHPLLLTGLLNKMYVDEKVRGDYVFVASGLQVNEYIFNIMSLIFLILGIIFAYYKVSLKKITIFFILLSILDLFHLSNLLQLKLILLHYFIFILPTLIILSKNKLQSSKT